MDRDQSTTLRQPRPPWFWLLVVPAFVVLMFLWVGMLALAWVNDEALWRLPFVAFSLCAGMSFAVLVQIRTDYRRRVAWEEAEAQDAFCAAQAACYDGPDNPAEGIVTVANHLPEFATDLSANQLEAQENIRSFLVDHPEFERRLGEIVAWEKTNPPKNQYDGWNWYDTHTTVRNCNILIAAGILNVVYDSRSSTQYRLVSRLDTEEAMANLHLVPNVDPSTDTTSLFRFVVGNERAKQILLGAIEADKPVHVLLTGPPGTAKTLMLSDIGALPGAEFYAGSTTTKAGLVTLLLSKRPKYLVIDEIDKMATEDMNPLLNLMQEGVVTRLQARAQQRETMDTRVFAGGNEVEKISKPILSRFARVPIPAYTPSEFVQVAQAVLVQREGIGPEVAMLIASSVVAHSTDIRDAVRVARLSRGRAVNVDPTVASLFSDRPGQTSIFRPVR